MWPSVVEANFVEYVHITDPPCDIGIEVGGQLDLVPAMTKGLHCVIHALEVSPTSLNDVGSQS